MDHTLLPSNPPCSLSCVTFFLINVPYWKTHMEVDLNISIPIPIAFNI
jgi:hypothetical protein